MGPQALLCQSLHKAGAFSSLSCSADPELGLRLVLSLPENSCDCPCVATHDTQGATKAGRQHCQGTSRSCREWDHHQEEGEEGEMVTGADCPLVPGPCDTSTAAPASSLPCNSNGEL